MSREKQIEEMAVDMCLIDRCKHLPQAECHNTTCAHCEAEALYSAGYRKQSEAVKELLEIIGGLLYKHYNGDVTDKELYVAFGEIENKYSIAKMKGGAE